MNTHKPVNSLGYILKAADTDLQMLAYTTAQQALIEPVSGNIIYNTTRAIPLYHDGDIWVPLAGDIFDANDHSKTVYFDLSGIPASTRRKITVPNYDIDLGLIWDPPSNLKLLTNTEAAQLLNINATTISAANWGYLGVLDQAAGIGASPQFGSPLLKTSLILEDPGVGANTVTIRAPTLAGDWTLTLPTVVGSQYEFLRNSGAGSTEWSAEVSETNFRIGDFSDAAPANWKRLGFAVSSITPGATRSITIPDYNVNLGIVPAASGNQYEFLRNAGSGLGEWSAEVSEASFRIGDFSDPAPANWKRVAFEVSGLTAAATRTVTLPDDNVNLTIAAMSSQKLYTAQFVVAGSTVGPVYPRLTFTFATTTPFYAEIKMVTTDWANDARIGYWSGAVCGGTTGVNPASTISVAYVSSSGDVLAMFSTATTSTASTVTLIKNTDQSAGSGNYWCKIFVFVGNGSLSTVVDPNTATTLATFAY
jgi:hypothetical protein